MNTTILGAGSFGTAMAVHLTSLGHNVKMWTIDAEQAEIMNREHRNNFCFFDTALPDKIAATIDLREALDFSDRYIMAIPTQFEREVCGKIAALSPA